MSSSLRQIWGLVSNRGVNPKPSGPSPAEVSTLFVPRVKDVHAAQEVLQDFLPMELIHLVLDLAEYWPEMLLSETILNPSLEVAALRTNGFIASHCCFISPQIPELCPDGKTKLKVRRVAFHITSHDQGRARGFASGLYDGSWTWFEAAIFRGLDQSLINTGFNDPNDIAITVANWEGSENEEGPIQVVNPLTGKKVWALQKNRRSSIKESQHEVVWDESSHDEEFEGPFISATGTLPTDRFSSETGSGSGQGFVRAIQSGDNIAVFARAQYSGWVNHVIEVSVQISYAL